MVGTRPIWTWFFMFKFSCFDKIHDGRFSNYCRFFLAIQKCTKNRIFSGFVVQTAESHFAWFCNFAQLSWAAEKKMQRLLFFFFFLFSFFHWWHFYFCYVYQARTQTFENLQYGHFRFDITSFTRIKPSLCDLFFISTKHNLIFCSSFTFSNCFY